MSELRTDGEAGVALPTALLAMLILLTLGGLLASYASSEQRATRTSESFEVGLHVAETAAELAIAALADPSQPQPVPASTSATSDPAGPRAWAVARATEQVDATCSRFATTAGGDGIAVVDDVDGTVYGIAFLPDCQNRRTTRVMRVAFDNRPVRPLPAQVTILTGGNVHFDGNARLSGGLHANGNIVGGPHQASGGVTAGGSCAAAHSSCVPDAGVRSIPNYDARRFWDVRNEPQVNPNNDPFYELCPDGTVRINSTEAPCDGAVVPTPHPSWVFSPTYTYPSSTIANASWGPTWRWTANHSPPDGIYYAYRANLVSEDNSGTGTSSRFTVMAEADRSQLAAGNGAHSGNIAFTSNPKFFASWPGVAVVADVDLLIERNISAFGQTTLIFVREQFQFFQNGTSERLFFIACDASLVSPTYDEDDPGCESPASTRNTLNSPLSTTRVRLNTTFEAPGAGDATTPNLGITGIADWEALY